MIYIDTSVLLAQLLAADRRPPPKIWQESLLASRLLEYEVWCRLHARDLASSHGEPARQLLGRISFLELSPLVLGRALEPFPDPVRTLDALHLASIEFLRGRRPRRSPGDLRPAHERRRAGAGRPSCRALSTSAGDQAMPDQGALGGPATARRTRSPLSPPGASSTDQGEVGAGGRG